MTLSEMATLLGRVALEDKRTIGAADVHHWHEIAGHVDYSTAIAAFVSHCSDQPDVYFKPGHVVQYAKRQGGTNAQAPYNRTVREAFTNGTVANCDHGYAAPERECGICRRGTGPLRIVGAA